ncbi:MAG: cobyrinate a,c-diamide synthase [Pseudomonadota bacterium]
MTPHQNSSPTQFGGHTRGFIVAGTNSGCGKTTVSLALMAWLTRQGYRVSPFKVGPDFIDPGHHTRITGTQSRNLDGWILGPNYNRQTFRTHARNSDIAVIEGVMGLFDGFSGTDEAGSTAEMAKCLGLPIILVVNAQSMARSAAALVQGFENFDPGLTFAGVIFNNIGSETHLLYLEQALKGNVIMPCLGGILRDDDIEIPERHLGLVTRDEHKLPESVVDHLSDIIHTRIDTKRLFQGLTRVDTAPLDQHEKPPKVLTPKTVIGVARDEAFCFYYQDNLDLLEKQGCTLIYFSPISDKRLPQGLQGLYLGGGYPEVFARQLSENHAMLADINEQSMNGMPVYGECGGFMYLCSSITDQQNRRYPMTGCFPIDTTMLAGRATLGYREITLTETTILGPRSMVIRGHEFHYSRVDSRVLHPDVKQVYSVSPGTGIKDFTEGYQTRNTVGSYIHLHFGSNPDLCRHFARSADHFPLLAHKSL